MSDEKQVNESPFVVVGIDYGTTYSGAAWAKSGALDQVEVISQWSSHTLGATDSEKVPSDIAYNLSGIPCKWGFQVNADDNPFRWTKLLLTNRSLANMANSQENVLDNTRRLLKQYQKSAIDVIADYLKFLWKHILDRLQKRLTVPVLNNMLLKVVLTIPAIWDHSSQENMLAAARKAGIDAYRTCGKTEIKLIAEPAAAALATYVDSGLRVNPVVKAGDSFLVCDAGGGTVDLIGYTINSFEPFELRECDLCGAIYLDRAFKAHVTSFRPHLGKLDNEAEKRFMEKEWEYNLKRNFDGTDGQWVVELPQKEKKSRASALKAVFTEKKSNILRLEGEHLRQIFTNVVDKIVDLIRDQVEGIRQKTGKYPKVIILVGGFGENRYLLQQVEEQFKSTLYSSQQILIQQPSRAWSAVCRGAVHQGAFGGRVVVNHVSKYSYGPMYSRAWVEGRFDKRDKVFSERWQEWHAEKQMNWYLRKHDDVSKIGSVEHNFDSLYRTAEELANTTFIIFYSDMEQPGSRLTAGIEELCTIKVHFETWQFATSPVYRKYPGKEYRRVRSVLKMDVSVSSIQWSVSCNGEEIPVTVVYKDVNSAAQVPT
ncbi:hypothetical protein G7Y89_g5117 [Cudoniella acicularis]|uniref:Uncharacterized protein n=1 Tax=Cudoniella acicularis TaxID=354080 RepID=A0A8H4RR84_9HELO|nr:hypothetical protein G7Y89_g5117 [Cudoniella acicularis]